MGREHVDRPLKPVSTTTSDEEIGEATDAEVSMAAAGIAHRLGEHADRRGATPHKCPKGRCCWHDGAPFRAIRDRHVADAVAAHNAA